MKLEHEMMMEKSFWGIKKAIMLAVEEDYLWDSNSQ
jgi:hypothetical protein